MGASRGLDEGMTGTTATLQPFIQQFGLKDPSLTADEQANRKSTITSMVQLGSIGGALIAFYLSDKLGRIRACQQLCLVWALGAAIYISSTSLGQLYAGRLIMGLGIGQTTVVAPTFLAEVSPKGIRGACTTVFAGAVFFGIMLGYLVVYGSEQNIAPSLAAQWRVPNSLHLIFAGLIFLGSFFVLESPRWLLKVGRADAAAATLAKYRGVPASHHWVQGELRDIQLQLQHEQETVRGASWRGILKELFTIKSNLYRLYIGVFTQLLGQWSGTSSITIYAPDYFAIAGYTGESVGLLTTCVLGVVEFVAALVCAFFLVDWLGRKRSLGIGISLQFLAMLYVALYVFLDPGAEAGAPQSASQRAAGLAAIVAIYLCGCGWALGWNSVQYLINAEIFPLRLRSLGTSLVMVCHFANQYGNTKAVPEMFLSMGKGGTLLFFAVVTAVGFVWVLVSVPELAGKSLEEIDAVFELSWWRIGIWGGREGRVRRDGEEGLEREKEIAVEVERVGSRSGD